MDQPQTISVHDVGAYLESAYLRDTSRPYAASLESPDAAAPRPVGRPSAAFARPHLQSAFSPCASAEPAVSPRPPARSLLRRRRNAARTHPATYAHIY